VTARDFSHPEWLAWLLAAWCAAAAALLLARARAARLRRRHAPALWARPVPARDAALLLALAATCAALAGPRIGERVLRVPAAGLDVVLLLDVSRSMDAADVPPSRFARAQRAAQGVLARLAPGDRAALAAFASRGVLLTPLTPDHGALSELLEALDTDLVHPAGSDLASGVRAALSAFERGSERPRAVFVLSDGEDPERRGDLGSADALDAGARVVAAAFGSEAGSRVPDHGVALRDAEGTVVVSQRRADRLERLAAASGGALFLADAWGEIDLAAAVRELRREAGTAPSEWVERRLPAVRVLPFAAAAFALLAAEGLALPRRAAAAALAALGLALLGGPGARAARGDDPEARLAAGERDAALFVALGAQRLERGEHGAAKRAFLAAALTARDPALAALAYYDLGVAALAEGEFAAARDAFFDALALAPGDREARFNLEWALAALAEGPPAAPAEPPPAPASDPAPPESAPEPARLEPSAAPALDPDERRRWLGRVRDDLEQALRSAAGGTARARRPGERAW
jgi:Ca-activated chloride channel family protein